MITSTLTADKPPATTSGRYGHNGYASKTYHHMPGQRVVAKGKTRAVCGTPVRSVSTTTDGRTECLRCRKARGF